MRLDKAPKAGIMGIYSLFRIKKKQMPRHRRPRRVCFSPGVTFFKPRGVKMADLETVGLGLDELEALRLVDAQGFEQTKAAQKMSVSQSTLQRILTVAREKTATALVKGLAIEMKGGEIIMPRLKRGLGQGAGPATGSGRGRMGGQFAAGPGGMCVCTNPNCQHKATHTAGKPCYQMKCEKCGSPMIRQR